LSRKKGDIYEQKAVKYLKGQGFEIIDKNFYAKKLGEIDIIAKKDNIYHFIEVKSGDSFDAVYNVTPQKISKIKKSIEYYLQKKKLNVFYSIDVVIFQKDKIEYLKNITF